MKTIVLINGGMWDDNGRHAQGDIVDVTDEQSESLCRLGVAKVVDDEQLEKLTAPVPVYHVEAEIEKPVEFNPFSAPESVKRGRPSRR